MLDSRRYLLPAILLLSATLVWAQTFEDTLALAESGDVDAQFLAGYSYLFGEEVDTDYFEAAYWLALASDSGHMDAEYYIGAMYAAGAGLSKDFSMAARHYAYAAQQGHGYAQFELAHAYEYGLGVKQDTVLAYMWYSIAYETATQLSDNELSTAAMEGRDLVALGMTNSEVAEARIKALNFVPDPQR